MQLGGHCKAVLRRSGLRIVLRLLIVAFLTVTSVPDLQASEGTQYPVFLVAARQADDSVASGTSFLASSRSGAVLITSHHVIEAAVPGGIFIRARNSWLKVRPVYRDPSSDLAALRPESPMAVAPLRVRRTTARSGEQVLVVGFPLPDLVGLSPYTIAKGVVLADNFSAGGISGFWFSAPVGGGNSGGPVLDASGQVVGIVTFRRARKSEGYAVHAFYLAKLLGGR